MRSRATIAAAAALFDFAGVTLSSVGVDAIYHLLAYGTAGRVEQALAMGSGLASVFVILSMLRNEYAAVNFLEFAGQARRVALVWNTTVLAALVLLYAARESAMVSRMSMLLLYAAGFLAVTCLRAMLVGWVRRRAGEGDLCLLRAVLVGSEAELQRFAERYRPGMLGMEVVAAAVLRGDDTLAEDLSLAAAVARIRRPDDIFILSSWTRSDIIDAAVAAFMRVPAALHLATHQNFDRFGKARLVRIGPIASVNVVRPPLTSPERFAKRAVDIVGASLALVALAPVLLALAALVRIDSAGPAIFVQRRGGFNRHSFRLYKFRTMRCVEDGPTIEQAARGDARVTRIGRWMRRFNLDELPQLWNVLRGDMSLVGPRPHAVAHDYRYARTIADYARRHNVKPGITGWAQVNGHRGGTASEAAMKARVDHDLWYIDNWSLDLDLRILVLTLISLRAFRNAY